MLARTLHAIVLPALAAGAVTAVSVAPSLGPALAGATGLAAFAVGEWAAFGLLWLLVALHDGSTES